MIKLIQCVRHKPDLSIEQFRKHWLEYGEKVASLARASKAVKFSLSTTLVVDQNMLIMLSRGTRPAYDGVVEVWWEKGSDVLMFLKDPTGKDHISDLQQLQESFIELAGSTFFFTSEEQRFGQ